jgi:hypothetical protein
MTFAVEVCQSEYSSFQEQQIRQLISSFLVEKGMLWDRALDDLQFPAFCSVIAKLCNE